VAPSSAGEARKAGRASFANRELEISPARLIAETGERSGSIRRISASVGGEGKTTLSIFSGETLVVSLVGPLFALR